MDDTTRPRDYEGEVAARIAFPALFKVPTERTPAEVRALDIVLGNGKRTPEMVKA